MGAARCGSTECKRDAYPSVKQEWVPRRRNAKCVQDACPVKKEKKHYVNQ
jgi:hypothetical protein